MHRNQAQLAARARNDFSQVVPERAERAQGLPGALDQTLAGFGHCQRRSRPPFQNPNTELRLQTSKRMRKRGLRDVHFARGAGDAAGFHAGQEVFQIAKLHPLIIHTPNDKYQ